jgi:hypothetical protein
MALTGELSDLALAELIEFFCNQRKTGRLKVIYPHLPGYFYIQAGALVDARIGSLSGIEAVYYALTLPNASFKFETEREPEQRTIHQPWTQVVLEGLRRMDEGVSPEPPINKEELPDENDLEEAFENVITVSEQSATLPMALTVDSVASGGRKRKMLLVAVVAAVLIGVTATVVFTKGFVQSESTASIPPVAVRDLGGNDVDASANNGADPATGQLAETAAPDQNVEGGAQATDTSALMLRREREARAREQRRADENTDSWPAKTATTPSAAPSPSQAEAKKTDAPKTAPKTATVTVSYDEAGRVTQASGSDATALRIARQKRFPSGKPGTTTITIPIN